MNAFTEKERRGFNGSCHANLDTHESICDGILNGAHVRIVVIGGDKPLPLTVHWPQYLRELADSMER